MDRRHTFRMALVAVTGIAVLGATGCFRSGLWAVGSQIDPGLYRSLDAENGQICDYVRWSPAQVQLGAGFSGRGNGPQYVEVLPTDGWLETAGCEMWVAAPANQSALPSGPPLTDGMWRVGVDIQPGTYSTSGSAVCSWSRLANARHDATSVIEEASVPPGAFELVVVGPGDAFFETRGCGPWQKLGV